MIEDKLGIIIPTYNRDKYLENTLSQLLNSPFIKCPITIFDNNSSDNTPKVCEKYEKLFPNFTVVRRPKNIGGDANILRAFETATTEFNWVLGDNDYLDFSKCNDVIESIESGNFDLILISSPGFPTPNWNSIQEALKMKNKKMGNKFLETNGEDLINILDVDYFVTMTFMSAYIYKSNLFDSNCLMKGYRNITNLFSHYPFIVKVFEDNLSIYKSKNDIIIVQPNPSHEKPELYLTSSWLNSCLLIKDKKYRKIGSKFPEGSTLPVTLGHIIFAKALEEEDLQINIISLKCVFRKLYGSVLGGFYNIIISIISLLPKSICKIIYDYYIENKRKILSEFN